MPVRTLRYTYCCVLADKEHNTTSPEAELQLLPYSYNTFGAMVVCIAWRVRHAGCKAARYCGRAPGDHACQGRRIDVRRK